MFRWTVLNLFMECVILIEDHWFLIAGYSVFLHGPSTLDDCADKSRFQYPGQSRGIY
ncbi:hypothetical protein V8B55DRAFT_1492156 [Mucor lusitanicus]